MRRGSVDGAGNGADSAAGSASSRKNFSAPAGKRGSGQLRGKNVPVESGSRRNAASSSTSPACETVTTSSGGKAFRVQVPTGASPGDTLRFRAPDNRLIEIDLPPGCKPGQKVTIEVDPKDDWRETLKQLSKLVKTNFEATTASCTSLKERLAEELELQKGLWASASATPQSDLYSSRHTASGSMLVVSGAAEELSQTQALVFASADSGDCKQLLAALTEARKFSHVSRTLEECCKSLTASEEAMVTWRCLLDALEANNRHEIEVWVEEARVLGLEVPSGLPSALQELCRLEEESLQHFARAKDTEDRIKFALEADDPELLAEVVEAAEKLGIRGPLVTKATARMRLLHQQRVMGGAEAGAGFPPRRSSTNGSNGSSSSPKSLGGGQRHPRQKSPRRSDSPPPLSPKADGRVPTHPGFGSAGGGSSASSSFHEAHPHASTFNAGGAEAGAGPLPGVQRLSKEAPYSQTASVPDDGKTMKELLEECRRHCLDTKGCLEADDLRRVLINRPKAEAPEARQGFVKQIPASQVNQANQTGVWNRLNPPPQHVTKRSKALYLLGLDPIRTPTSTELRSAYRKAAMECHPDRAQNHSRQEQAKDLFQKVKEAFDSLSGSQS